MHTQLPIAAQYAIGSALLFLLLLVIAWLVIRRRPTPEEVERRRRLYLGENGRIVDGMLLDFYDLEGPAGTPIQMLVYSYRISGVDYECSQDVSALGAQLGKINVRAGFPCSVRYQPGNPQNSIVIAEIWSGLREGLPVLANYDDPDPLDLKYTR